MLHPFKVVKFRSHIKNNVLYILFKKKAHGGHYLYNMKKNAAPDITT